MLTFTYTNPDMVYTSLNDINESCPGIYVFKNQNKDCLYVGKAEQFKSRMSSYKNNGSHLGKDFFQMVESIELYFVPVHFLECYEIMMINYLNPIYNSQNVLMNHNVCIDYNGIKRAYGDDISQKIKEIEEVYKNKIKKLSISEITIESEKKKHIRRALKVEKDNKEKIEALSNENKNLIEEISHLKEEKKLIDEFLSINNKSNYYNTKDVKIPLKHKDLKSLCKIFSSDLWQIFYNNLSSFDKKNIDSIIDDVLNSLKKVESISNICATEFIHSIYIKKSITSVVIFYNKLKIFLLENNLKKIIHTPEFYSLSKWLTEIGIICCRKVTLNFQRNFKFKNYDSLIKLLSESSQEEA